MTASLITDARTSLADDLSHADWPTHLYMPEDIGEAPCYILGKPVLNISDQFMAIDFPVFVVGRGLADEEAQRELDEVMETALVLLRGPDVALGTVQPTVLTFGQNTFPVYLISAVLSGQFC